MRATRTCSADVKRLNQPVDPAAWLLGKDRSKRTLANMPEQGSDSANRGCVRLENPDQIFRVLGHPVKLGPIRLTLTDATPTQWPPTADGERIVLVHGDGSSDRIIEPLLPGALRGPLRRLPRGPF